MPLLECRTVPPSNQTLIGELQFTASPDISRERYEYRVLWMNNRGGGSLPPSVQAQINAAAFGPITAVGVESTGSLGAALARPTGGWAVGLGDGDGRARLGLSASRAAGLVDGVLVAAAVDGEVGECLQLAGSIRSW